MAGIKAYWMKHTNFGDALTPYLIKKISGQEAVFTEAFNGRGIITVTGSILSTQGIENCIVWGNGYAWSNEDLRKPMEIKAVRGKRSAQKLRDAGATCPHVYGDPALLLPDVYNPTPKKQYKLGIIPHILDYYLVAQNHFDISGVKVIDLNDPVEKVIWEINQCEATISSSLHGIIASHAYEIPSGWVEFSDKVIGDGFKFWDYFSSVGLTDYFPVQFRAPKKYRFEELMNGVKEEKINFDKEALWEVCPIPKL